MCSKCLKSHLILSLARDKFYQRRLYFRLRPLCSSLLTNMRNLWFLVHNERKCEQAHILPRSNIAWECCIQRMAIRSSNPVTGNRTENHFHLSCTKFFLAIIHKRYRLLLKRDQNSVSCKNAYLHIMSFITTKFHEILLSGFSGVVLTNWFE